MYIFVLYFLEIGLFTVFNCKLIKYVNYIYMLYMHISLYTLHIIFFYCQVKVNIIKYINI